MDTLETKGKLYPIFFLVIFGTLVFQQVQVQRLNKIVGSAVVPSADFPGQSTLNTKTIIQSHERVDITGTIVEVGKEYVVLEEEMQDGSSGVPETSGEAPLAKRRFRVMFDSQTQFIKLRQSDLLVGKQIVVVAPVAVNTVSEFIARIIALAE